MRCRAAFALVLLACSAEAGAADQVVSQKNRQFQQGDAKLETITVKAGDSVVFRNDDRYAHNVFSRTPGQEFDLGTLRPGAAAQHSFAAAGTAEVECALHPNMKFKLVVTP